MLVESALLLRPTEGTAAVPVHRKSRGRPTSLATLKQSMAALSEDGVTAELDDDGLDQSNETRRSYSAHLALATERALAATEYGDGGRVFIASPTDPRAAGPRDLDALVPDAGAGPSRHASPTGTVILKEHTTVAQGGPLARLLPPALLAVVQYPLELQPREAAQLHTTPAVAQAVATAAVMPETLVAEATASTAEVLSVLQKYGLAARPLPLSRPQATKRSHKRRTTADHTA